jgi:NADH-quinone oxidoreductase subunit A
MMMITTYLPVCLAILLAAGLGITFLVLFRVLGPYHETPQKCTTYECGVPPSGDAHSRFMVRFYLVGAIFILFDLEVVFLYPWAVLYRKLGFTGLVEMFLFLGILGIGLLYVVRKGALKWQ